jgi:hypothetical protein
MVLSGDVAFEPFDIALQEEDKPALRAHPGGAEFENKGING